MKKVFLTLSAFILIAAACNQQTPIQPVQPLPPPQAQTPPTNWKTYTNTEWGFSISYPNKYTLEDNHFKKERPYFKNLLDIVSVPNNASNPSLSIQVVNDVGERNPVFITDVKEYLKQYSEADYGKPTAITINGSNGYEFSYKVGGTSFRHVILQDKTGVIYDLLLPGKDNSDFNQILQTFTFIK